VRINKYYEIEEEQKQFAVFNGDVYNVLLNGDEPHIGTFAGMAAVTQGFWATITLAIASVFGDAELVRQLEEKSARLTHDGLS
jgi:hypothetical protein